LAIASLSDSLDRFNIELPTGAIPWAEAKLQFAKVCHVLNIHRWTLSNQGYERRARKWRIKANCRSGPKFEPTKSSLNLPLVGKLSSNLSSDIADCGGDQCLDRLSRGVQNAIIWNCIRPSEDGGNLAREHISSGVRLEIPLQCIRECRGQYSGYELIEITRVCDRGD
jgi:hypothetical protein